MLALIVMALLGSQLFSVYEAKDVFMVGYVGKVPDSYDRPDLVKSAVASFEGYEIITQPESYGCKYSDWKCAANTCGGTQSGADEFGCQLYTADLCYASRSGNPSVGPYKNSACGWATKSINGKEVYDFSGCNLNDLEKCGTVKPYCYSSSCQSTYQMKYDVPAGPSSCGGRTRDQTSCGQGCYARFIIMKDGLTVYDTVDPIRTSEAMLIPDGLTEASTLKTLCMYSSHPGYIPCIYEDGPSAGEYAPISYCESKYGALISCDEVLLDEAVERDIYASIKDEDRFINSKLLKVLFNQESRFDNGECKMIRNDFVYVIPDDAIDVTIEVPPDGVVGGNITATVKIQNSWKDVLGNLTIDYEVDTGLLSSSKERQSIVIEIPKGLSVQTFQIPARKTALELKVTPTIHILMSGSGFSGVNGKCFGQQDSGIRDLSRCEYVGIGTVTDTTWTVRISDDSGKVQVETKEGAESVVIAKSGEKTLVQKIVDWIRSFFERI